MFLGTVDDWTAEGTVVSWYPTEASHASAAQAARHPAPVSYQQSQHLQHYRRQTNLGRDIPRLCIGVWEIMGVCDIDAMTQAINTHVRRHDTDHDRFGFHGNDEIPRYVVDDPETITPVPTDHATMTPPQIRNTPDPLQWDCFTFGIIQGEDRFTVYIAIDHLRADGMSAGVVFLDIQTTYFTTLQSAPAALTPAANHREYCINQRAHTANLNEESPQIQSWRAFLAASAGAAARPDAHLCANLGTLQQTGCDPVHPSFPSADRAVSCSAVTDSWHAWAHSHPHLPKADQIVRRVN